MKTSRELRLWPLAARDLWPWGRTPKYCLWLAHARERLILPLRAYFQDSTTLTPTRLCQASNICTKWLATKTPSKQYRPHYMDARNRRRLDSGFSVFCTTTAKLLVLSIVMISIRPWPTVRSWCNIEAATPPS